MANRILVTNYCRVKLDQKVLKDKIDEVLRRKGLSNGVELSVVLAGKKRARKLNIEYRKKDYYPQMLEFPMSREIDVDGYIRLGDIVICVELLNKDVKKYKKSQSEVLDEWLVHGVNNLLQ